MSSTKVANSAAADDDDAKPKPRHRRGKNQPLDTKWRQQTLSAFRPVFTATAVCPWTTAVGVVFIGIGILLFITNSRAKELIIDYTDCKTMNGSEALIWSTADGDSASAKFVQFTESKALCKFEINLTKDWNGTVKFFYGLDGFYQNTRMYVKSRSDIQLAGSSIQDLFNVGDCKPYDEAKLYDSATNSTKNVTIAPCGKIADSMFNDTFIIKYSYSGIETNVPMTTRGMIYRENDRKYRNPTVPNGNLCDAFANTTKPLSWQKPICELGDDDVGRGLENKDFQVWMEIAALPKFRKIYRLLDRQQDPFAYGMPQNHYTLEIAYNYNVSETKIRKLFIIAIETWSGPKNLFLPIAYIVVGIALLVMSLLLLFIYLRNRYQSR